MKHHELLLVVILNVVFHVSANVGRANDAINLNPTDQEKFNKFKERVMPKLTQPYMMTDTYLIRWMRAKNFNEMEAETMLLQSLQWRKEKSMDTIHTEDWSVFKKNYPVVAAKDRDGRPTIIFLLGLWDIGFNYEKLLQYYGKVLDETALQVFDMQKNGSNLTRWIHMFDEDKLKLCMTCNQFFLRATNLYELNYPQLADRIVLFNLNKLFDKAISIIKGAMTPDSKEALKTYDTDRGKWEAEMTVWMDTTQLPGVSTIKSSPTTKAPEIMINDKQDQLPDLSTTKSSSTTKAPDMMINDKQVQLPGLFATKSSATTKAPEMMINDKQNQKPLLMI